MRKVCEGILIALITCKTSAKYLAYDHESVLLCLKHSDNTKMQHAASPQATNDFITNFKTNIYIYTAWENNQKLEPVVALCISFVILIITIGKVFQQKRKNLNRKKSLYEALPRIQWSFLNLSILDGFITLVKIRKHGVRVCDELITKFGTNFRCTVPWHQVLVLTDPKIIQKVLSSSNPSHLNKPTFLYKIAFSNELKDSLMTADYDTWSLHRKIMSRPFNYNSFPNFLKIMNEEGKCFVNAACVFAIRGNGSVDKKQFMNLLELHATKTIAKIMVGSESANVPDKQWEQLNKALSRGKELSSYRFLNPLLWFPPMWAINRYRFEMDQLMHSIRKFVLKVTKNYRIDGAKEKISNKNANTVVDKNSTTDADLNSIYTTSASVVEHMIVAGLTEKNIQDEFHLFMGVGQDTISVAMNFLLFHLASNIQIQKNCQTEIFGLMKANGYSEDEHLTLEDLSELKYLERCILESLRLSPTVPIVLRRMDKDLDIDEEYIIEAGQYVMIVAWATHRNPKDFPNPEKFDPDRFLPENVKKRHSHSFLPFSMGTRNCIGWKVALLEMKVLSSWILRNFEVTTNDKPNDVKILYGITITPERPFDLYFKVRK